MLLIWKRHAAVVELADTIAPGAIALTGVGVRIPPAASVEGA